MLFAEIIYPTWVDVDAVIVVYVISVGAPNFKVLADIPPEATIVAQSKTPPTVKLPTTSKLVFTATPVSVSILIKTVPTVGGLAFVIANCKPYGCDTTPLVKLP